MSRRLAVIMAADMVGYTALMRQSESAALTRLRALREQLFEPVAAAHGGEILKRLGDGWIVAFTSVSGAVAAAQAVQAGLARQSEAELRIGLHLGDLVEGEADWYGDCINIAARLQGEAEPGGLMASGDILRLLDRAAAAVFEPRGRLDLKNVDLAIEGHHWRPRAEAPSIGIPRLALVPPSVLPDGPEMRVLADDALASIAFRFSRRTGLIVVRDADEADYLLDMSLRRSGARLRATLSLRFVSEDEAVWTGTVEGNADDPLDWIDRLTDRVDASVRHQTNARDSRRTEGLTAEELDVNGLLTRAAAEFHRGTHAGYAEGCRLSALARERDPKSAMALAMWVESLAALRRAERREPTPEEARSMREGAERAAALSPESDYVLMVLSLMRSFVERDFVGAAAAAARSLEISPAYCYGHAAAAIAALGRGRIGEAREAAGQAAEHGADESFLPQFLAMRALAELLDGALEEAETSIAAAIMRAPGRRGFLDIRAAILSAQGRGETARRAREEAAATPLEPSPLDWNYPMPAALCRRFDQLITDEA